ncbi:hypothetical protein CN326_14920 [Bacillus sp. AFS018417]|uniref:hypothetical protein n=1 Tax=Bacillus sp. AFS018417 TaxID=2033491 RepID=UPI000BF5B029|nr:hypothetical protein [Bacillus sp. AFS018417]PEZ05301.1 hypothetical protein CN326_14920 [Bacillus sp. AFS018417]
MSGFYLGITNGQIINNSFSDLSKRENKIIVGKPGRGRASKMSDWFSKDLIQAISIAQAVIKLKERYDVWIESTTKLLAGSILYLDQRHGNLYYLDLEQVREFIQKAKD